MNMIWLCITSLLSITLVISDQNIDPSHLRVFPGVNQSIAGVFQVSYLNDLNQPHYAFNASEARRLCLSLGVNMASKAQVKEALARGLETCRFGWVDEHFAVIPRSKALISCGQNQTGLVTWRASVRQKFDAFCFNESDAATQLKDTTTDSPLNSRARSEQTQPHTQNVHSAFSSTLLPPSSSNPESVDLEAEPARFVGTAQGSAGATAILIASICSLLLVAVIIIAYIKLKRSRTAQSDTKEQQEYIQTEEWTSVKNVKETETAAQEEDRIEVGDDAS